MGTMTIIYLSGCILSLTYGILISGKITFREVGVLAVLSTLSWLAVFALLLGHGFNIVNNSEREEQYSLIVFDHSLKPLGKKKIITGIHSLLDTTHYDLANSENIIVGKVFTALNLYIVDDYRILKAPSSLQDKASSPKKENNPNNGNADENHLLEVHYNFTATTTHSRKKECILSIDKCNHQLKDMQLLLHITGEKAGIVFFDHIRQNISLQKLPPDNYRIRLIDFNTGHCIFEKEEFLSNAYPSPNGDEDEISGLPEPVQTRIIVSGSKFSNTKSSPLAADDFLRQFVSVQNAMALSASFRTIS